MRFLGALILVLGLTMPAHAETSVDWSQYIDTTPAKTPSQRAEQPAKLGGAAKSRQRVARPSKTKASKAKVKARAKKPSRRK